MPETEDVARAADAVAAVAEAGEAAAALQDALEEALRTVAQLRTAIVSHEVVAQATGVLVAHCGIDAARAFALLRKASQDHNVKLVRLSRAVVELAAGTGGIPADLGVAVEAVLKRKSAPVRAHDLRLGRQDRMILADATELLAAERDRQPPEGGADGGARRNVRHGGVSA